MQENTDNSHKIYCYIDNWDQAWTELTCGKGVSDERSTFSGLRSQWTMCREWRYLSANRIYAQQP